MPEGLDKISTPPEATARMPDASTAFRAEFLDTTIGKPAPSADVVPMTIEAPQQAVRVEIPQPVQAAIDAGTPVRFSSSGENQSSGAQPDYYLTPQGQLVKNENAVPSPDGSINIEIQSEKPEGNKSLRDAIIHQSEMQKAAAKEMIRLFQKNNPGKPVPGWMEDLASARPNIPDFVPAPSRPNQPASPPPENGFVNRGVRGGNSSGFAGNGGFDGSGYYKGNGSSGDGSLYSGGRDSGGKPMGPGETVKAKEIYEYMTQQHGLSPAIASGILGNMMTESSLKTNAYNPNENAIGLIQWQGGRRTALESFASEQGKPVTDWRVQVDFMMHELKTSESRAWSRLQTAQTPSEAAAIFDKYYERSAGTSRGERIANAENVHRNIAMA